MRRVWATLLLGLFSFSLIAPAFAESKPELPDCCRALGKHQCAMKRTSAQDRSGSAVKSSADECPNFPSLRAVQAHKYSPLLSATQTISGSLVSHPAGHAQTEGLCRAAFSRARQKRGPPSLLS